MIRAARFSGQQRKATTNAYNCAQRRLMVADSMPGQMPSFVNRLAARRRTVHPEI